MKQSELLLGLAIATLCAAALARSESPVVYSLNGVGTHSCGQYLEFTTGPERDLYRNLYQQWGSGFLAGYSFKASPERSAVADLPTITAWLDKFCRDDPSGVVSGGVVALRLKLPKQM